MKGVDLVSISAGFDAHADDPLGGLNFLEPEFVWATAELKKIAEEFCDKRIVSMLEGGYNLPALGGSAPSTFQVCRNFLRVVCKLLLK